MCCYGFQTNKNSVLFCSVLLAASVQTNVNFLPLSSQSGSLDTAKHINYYSTFEATNQPFETKEKMDSECTSKTNLGNTVNYEIAGTTSDLKNIKKNSQIFSWLLLTKVYEEKQTIDVSPSIPHCNSLFGFGNHTEINVIRK
jgi:hypothetical protein